MIDHTESQLEFMKTTDGRGLSEIKALIKVSDGKAFYKGEELKNHREEILSQFDTVRQNYLSNMAKNIKKRIPKVDSKIMLSLSQVLEPCVVNVTSVQESKEALKLLVEHYGFDKVVKHTEGDLTVGTTQTEKTVDKFLTGEELNQEWPWVYGMIKGTYKNLSIQDFCMRLVTKHHETCPNMAKLAVIALCMQVTSVECCARSFSTQNRIKSKFR
ncbi:hypothetical protein DPMN_128274 [Dreissena polymorpha]|uniref:HAT C-terminal dimerisation domain-containing protein n=1 Tax=Dreissena polymorpha TaxID=45954 RepID=A0A9D4JW92_DREPO|nr:hypothetical protein DPMN_128274 [Dreissena polymorpha]